MNLALALLFGGLIGLSLGSLGGGGSILVVPALVYGLSLPPKDAVIHAFIIVGMTSAVSAVLHWRHGFVRLSAAAMFAIAGCGGAYLGARMSNRVSDAALLVCLGAVMAVAGTMMFRSARRDSSQPAAMLHGSSTRKLLLPIAGFGVGFLTGFLGVGGGFLIVPALTLVAGMPVKESVGTSLVVIAANCLAGLAAQGFEPVDWSLIAPFLVASLSASTLAIRLARATSSANIKKLFACFVFVVGGLMLAGHALSVFVRSS